MTNASVNHLTEAGGIRQPPRLMLINQGGFLMSPSSVNVLTEMVAGLAAQPRLTEAGRQPNRLRGGFEKVMVKFFCSSVRGSGCMSMIAVALAMLNQFTV
jgi:hypothetical protein